MASPATNEASLNPSAGSELLQCYEDIWKELHSQTASSCRQAQEVAKLISAFASSCWKTNEKLVKLHSTLCLLPEIVQQVERLTTEIGRLQVSFEEVSSIISTYERLSNEVDKRRQLSEMQADLGNLKLSKMSELEQLKGELATKHAAALTQLQTKSQNPSP